MHLPRMPIGHAQRMAHLMAAAVLALAVPLTGYAQGPAPSVLWQRPAPSPARSLTLAAAAGARAPDHRWEGMAIGAGVGAVAFGLLGAAICAQSDANDDCTGVVLGAGLLGAFCGGITGGLIGGAIPKEDGKDGS